MSTSEIESYSINHKNNPRKFIKNYPYKPEKTVEGCLIRKLYIANLTTTTAKEVRKLFSPYGNITKLEIIRQNKCSKTTIGFITYSKAEEAARCLASKYYLSARGRKLYVCPAYVWHQPDYYGTNLYNPNIDILSMFGFIKPIANAQVDGADEIKTSESNDDSSIFDRLNDDCLYAIFSRLSVLERFPVAYVCRRWKRVIHSVMSTTYSLNNKIWNNQQIKKILSICGNIRVLTLTDQSFDIVPVIANTCQKLECLTLHINKLPKRSLTYIAESCKNLKNLILNLEHGKIDNRDVIRFLKITTNLEKIAIKQYTPDVITSKQKSCYWFTSLKPPLKSLYIDGIQLNTKAFFRGLQKVKSTLEELVLINLNNKIPFEKLPLILKNLKRLSIKVYRPRGGLFEFIGDFDNLEHVDLSDNVLSFSTLLQIVRKFPDLKKLNISGCDFSKDIGLPPLGQLGELSHLVELNLSLDHLTIRQFTYDYSIIIKQCINLKKLFLRRTTIKDEDCICALTHCKNLEVLDVSGCQFITDITLKKAVVMKRKHKLMIYIKESSLQYLNITYDCTSNKNLEIVKDRYYSSLDWDGHDLRKIDRNYSLFQEIVIIDNDLYEFGSFDDNDVDSLDGDEEDLRRFEYLFRDESDDYDSDFDGFMG